MTEKRSFAAIAASPQVTAEISGACAAVRRQGQEMREPLAALIEHLQRHPPDLVMTCARGSSAHAATFAKHLIERHLGIAVAAAAPNIATVYRRRLKLRRQLFLAVSQSGASDDLVEATRMARSAGALTVALVNEPQSPLAADCEIVLPMAAGPERSIAATKTFVASLAALLRLTAAWSGDRNMLAAVDGLPERLDRAGALDWSRALGPLASATSLVVIGRGPTLAIAREAALKLKETCALHAEAFSAAEFRHGPIALVESTYPVLVFTPTDEAQLGIDALVHELRSKGGCVLVSAAPAIGRAGDDALPCVAPQQADADAVCLIQTFYSFLVALAARRGTDIDRPRHLQKVTRTR